MIGNRKVIFGFSIVAIGIILDRFLPGGLSGNMLDLIKFVSGGFFLGNGIEHVTRAITLRGQNSDDSAPVVDNSAQIQEVINDVKATREENAKTAAALTTVQQALSVILQKLAKVGA